ncbi:hypothetical protein T265_00409 [Opisthorchis viverrini]|uniref:Uncharacterized protein n=1 Tax=Opisthorchis viverrini TaxID=6198 RepID=A0A075A304_OPIVI|nr:hypothetical protein T265_00409 [Opisthorchis viverrini]KER33721.1 hypothetical protein T265_00409 [Opisthorchis viverrini]
MSHVLDATAQRLLSDTLIWPHLCDRHSRTPIRTRDRASFVALLVQSCHLASRYANVSQDSSKTCASYLGRETGQHPNAAAVTTDLQNDSW